MKENTQSKDLKVRVKCYDPGFEEKQMPKANDYSSQMK